ncbi:MAG: dihydroorotase [Oscillospiraceae bacterium]|nr:dihydroorotase [Oscillospiraceae bacterium]
MNSILLKNGYIVDSKNDIEGTFDILIENGFITKIGEKNVVADMVVDCTGLVIIPGIFDMHVHFREPGQTHKEDIISGAAAAAAGGVTGVLCMPNTSPIVDSPDTLKHITTRAKKAKIRVYSACALTVGLKGEQLCDYKALRAAGAVAATDDGRPVENPLMMYKAMKAAHEAGLTVISHCEDLNLTNSGIMNEGKISAQLGVKGVTRASENTATAREIYIAKAYNLPIHIAHVSTKEAAELIKLNKDSHGWVGESAIGGSPISSETAPHYFTLTECLLLKRDADYRMAPPLREQADVNAIIAAIKAKAIDCIVTDHAPHTKEEKQDFENAPNGVNGLETSLAVTLTSLYHPGHITLKELVNLMCVNPRKRLGIPGGGLTVGDVADITIFEPNEEWTVEPEKFHSKSSNSCFKGMKLKGRVKYTIVGGNVIYVDGQVN